MNMNYPRVIIAGASSSAGKTTLTMGLALCLKKRGYVVQTFKAGPDYIDPSYHTFVSARPCRNLDTWMLSKDAVLELFERQAKLSDISIVEGVMGLYDGLQGTETASTAHLAKTLLSPVILIVDASSMSRSAAALVLGYREFDRRVDIKGVILNNVGSPSHHNSVKTSIEEETGMPVLGALARDRDLSLAQRHLGLIPTAERAPLEGFIKRLLNAVEDGIDVDRIIGIANSAGKLPSCEKVLFGPEPAEERATIAVARDAAFNFYYEDSLDILRYYGAKLASFSPLHDRALPKDADGLYIGGGFPEVFARELARNVEMKREIRRAARSGMPIYAECGGLIYLMKEMVGIFDSAVSMGTKLAGLGYVNLKVLKPNILSRPGDSLRAHLFHWSHIDPPAKYEDAAYRLEKDGKVPIADGLVRWNVLASYSHLHFGSDAALARNFIARCEGRT